MSISNGRVGAVSPLFNGARHSGRKHLFQIRDWNAGAYDGASCKEGGKGGGREQQSRKVLSVPRAPDCLAYFASGTSAHETPPIVVATTWQERSFCRSTVVSRRTLELMISAHARPCFSKMLHFAEVAPSPENQDTPKRVHCAHACLYLCKRSISSSLLLNQTKSLNLTGVCLIDLVLS